MLRKISVAALFDLLKSKKGWEKPGHKYLYRVPLPGGGYRYFYHNPKQGTSSQDFTDEENKRFSQDESFVKEEKSSIEDFLSFAKSDFAVKTYKKDIETNFTAFYGRTWEIFAALPQVQDIDDAVMKVRYYLDTYTDSHHQKILKDLTDRLFALKETKNDFHLARLVGDNKKMWDYFRQTSGEMYNIDFEDLRLVSTAHIQRKDIVSDLMIMDARQVDKNNDLGLLLLDLNTGIPGAIGISSKAFQGTSPITLKNNSMGTAIENYTSVADRLLQSGDSKTAHVVRSHAVKMKRAWDDSLVEAQSLAKKHFVKQQQRIDELKKQGATTYQKYIKKKMPEAETLTKDQIAIYREFRELTKEIASAINTYRSRKTEQVIFDALNDNVFAKGFTDDLYEVFSGAFSDSSVSEMVMVMPFYNKKTNDNELYVVRESKLKKQLKKQLTPGNFSIQMRSMGKRKIMGKETNIFSDVDIIAKNGLKIGTLRFRRDMGKVYTMLDEKFMMNFVRGNNELDALDRELASRGYAKSFISDLEKAVQTTERKKANAKYIRKELTESGNVRYIYKETTPRKKKEEEVPSDRRDSFISLIDSSDENYETLLVDSLKGIDDVHFENINAACNYIRITDDHEVFLDSLEAPDKLRNTPAFTNASGSFNVSKGKMAFSISNFPSGMSEIDKKAVMLHEVGHAFFYGALRFKHKQPLTSRDEIAKDDPMKKEKKEAQKALEKQTKDSIKFVDSFGKIDKEIREKAEQEVELSGAKGQDKETMLQDSIKMYMVSTYASISAEEHFAEAFSRYFITPELLEKKEKEVYDHFESYFGKNRK